VIADSSPSLEERMWKRMRRTSHTMTLLPVCLALCGFDHGARLWAQGGQQALCSNQQCRDTDPTCKSYELCACNCAGLQNCPCQTPGCDKNDPQGQCRPACSATFPRGRCGGASRKCKCLQGKFVGSRECETLPGNTKCGEYCRTSECEGDDKECDCRCGGAVGRCECQDPPCPGPKHGTASCGCGRNGCKPKCPEKWHTQPEPTAVTFNPKGAAIRVAYCGYDHAPALPDIYGCDGQPQPKCCNGCADQGWRRVGQTLRGREARGCAHGACHPHCASKTNQLCQPRNMCECRETPGNPATCEEGLVGQVPCSCDRGCPDPVDAWSLSCTCGRANCRKPICRMCDVVQGNVMCKDDDTSTGGYNKCSAEGWNY